MLCYVMLCNVMLVELFLRREQSGHNIRPKEDKPCNVHAISNQTGSRQYTPDKVNNQTGSRQYTPDKVNNHTGSRQYTPDKVNNKPKANNNLGYLQATEETC